MSVEKGLLVGTDTRLRTGRLRVRIPVATIDFSLYPNAHTPLLGPPTLPIYVYRDSLPGVKLTTHLIEVIRMRMSGAIPLPSLYAIVLWTGKALPLNLPYFS